MDSSQQIPFAEHIRELRTRLMWIVGALLIAAAAGYLMHDTLIQLLQLPLNENLYFNTPGGAFNFIIKVCTVFGLIISLPVIIYHVFAFFGPLITFKKKRTIVLYTLSSLVLAVAGIVFAYLVSLPAALHFLISFGDVGGIKSLITANEYFNFVLTYIAGFAVLFQVPLIVLLIDKIKPIPPSKLFKSLRYVVLVSFVVAAVITPTPDPMNQAIMAAPIIVLYMVTATGVAIRSSIRSARQTKVNVATKTAKYAPLAAEISQIPDSLFIEEPVIAPVVKPPVKPRQSVMPRPAHGGQLISDFMVVPRRPNSTAR